MGRRHLGKGDAKSIARERIERLFELAENEAKADRQGRAKRYVSLALRLGERHKVRTGHKRSYCTRCHAFFVPPRNVRVRTSRGNLSITCLACGRIMRMPLSSRR